MKKWSWFFLFCCVFYSTTGGAWGFFAHRLINRMAVFTLPPDLFSLFKPNITYLSTHAVDADKRRYAVQGEAEKHYIDIDHYRVTGSDVFDVMPERWSEAEALFSADTLLTYGILPWHIVNVQNRLTQAFRDQDVTRILKLAADLGHYIGDAHVPLHTTKNYNGQLTGQKGIHGLWESRLPELFHEEYTFFSKRAVYLPNPLRSIWQVVQDSHRVVDSVLTLEREATASFSSAEKYGYENRGASTVQVYSQEFSACYHDRLQGMVEKRMQAAIQMLGNFWYTAWVNGGQPEFSSSGVPFSSISVEDSLPKLHNHLER